MWRDLIKDMFANSKRSLAVATTGHRPCFYSQPSICLLFLGFLFCYVDSSKTKILVRPWPDSPSPFGRAFFLWYLVKSKIRKSTGKQAVACSITTRFLSQISPAGDGSLFTSVFCSNRHRSAMWYISNYFT